MDHITSFQLFNEGLFGFGKPDEESIKQAIGFLFIKPPKEDEFFYKELPDVGTMKPFHTDPSVKETTLMGLAKLLKKKSLNQAEKINTKKILKYIKKLKRMGKSDPGSIGLELEGFMKSYETNKNTFDEMIMNLN
jgi:hypothetical protein